MLGSNSPATQAPPGMIHNPLTTPLVNPITRRRFLPSMFPTSWLQGAGATAGVKVRTPNSSYLSRFQYFSRISSPFQLFNTQTQLSEALQFIQRCNTGAVQPTPANQQRLMKAITVRDSMVHPDTGETIWLPMRRAFFLPSNMPIFLGMLLSPQTVGWITTWQVVNNSYSCFMNYSNRNASSSLTGAQMVASMAAAVGISTTLAVRVRVLMDKVAHRPWAATVWGRALTQAVVPFIAMATSGTVNLISARYAEALEGIVVRDASGTELGRSVIAGRDAVAQTAMSRVLMPLLPASIPPLIMHGLQKYKPDVVAPFGRMVAIKTVVVASVLCIGLPFSLAPFPYCVAKPTSELEPEFHNMRNPRTGQRVDVVYYNRGL